MFHENHLCIALRIKICLSKEEYVLIGNSIQRLDIPEKVNGVAKFGIDIRLPNMLFATVRQSPIFGGKIISFEATKHEVR